MAEALFRRHLTGAGIDARVHSAGLLDGGRPPTPEGVEAMAALGLDTSAHLSAQVTPAALAAADLVVCMAREHVREAVVLEPGVWARAFTLKELVRRAEAAGARAPGQALDEWLDKVGAGRSQTDLLGSGPEDDVADPIGAGPGDYARTAAELDGLIGRLVELGWG